jgi:hypothetical protein
MTILGSFLHVCRREASYPPEPVPCELTHSPSDPLQHSAPGTIQRSPSFNAQPTTTSNNSPPTHRICLLPHINSNHAFHFKPISHDLRDGSTPICIGRFTNCLVVNAQSMNKIAFDTKVVSWFHVEIWSGNGRLYIKDTKLSSGTFLNHHHLSPVGSKSAPHQVQHGDIIQLSINYQGGADNIWKSIKIKIEVRCNLQELGRIKDDEEKQRQQLFTLSERQVCSPLFFPPACSIQHRPWPQDTVLHLCHRQLE